MKKFWDSLDKKYVKKLFFNNSSRFTKNKNIVLFEGCPELEYDFITGKLNHSTQEFCMNYYTREMLRYIKSATRCEWAWNYLDDLYSISYFVEHLPKEYYKKMPNGFSEVLKENELTTDLLLDYITKKKYNKYYKIVNNFGLSLTELDVFLQDYKFETLVKIQKNHFLNGKSLSSYTVRDFIYAYYKAKEVEKNFHIDTNRDFDFNIELLRDIIDREKNKLLATQMQKLNFINGLEFDNEYIVVVPQSQKEKREEGRMQNNCVGSFYDDSIMKGINLIYFIRKKNNPNHSYITCRYNVKANNTVEYRKVNNTSVRNQNEIDIIEKITDIINEKGVD